MSELKESQSLAVRDKDLSILRTNSTFDLKMIQESLIKNLVNEIFEKSWKKIEEKRFIEVINDDRKSELPRWQADSSLTACSSCFQAFTIFRRRVNFFLLK